jgi:hypothetical protein
MKNGEAIDLCELIERFGDDQKCRNYLERLRWPEGVRCPGKLCAKWPIGA